MLAARIRDRLSRVQFAGDTSARPSAGRSIPADGETAARAAGPRRRAADDAQAGAAPAPPRRSPAPRLSVSRTPVHRRRTSHVRLRGFIERASACRSGWPSVLVPAPRRPAMTPRHDSRPAGPRRARALGLARAQQLPFPPAAPPGPARARPTPRPRVDIVVPVYNEAAGLEASIRRLHAFPTASSFPFAWRIVIADNASTDATPQLARALAAELPDGERPAAGREGPRPRAARGLDRQRRRRAGLHGRRPLDRPARPAPARRRRSSRATATSRSARRLAPGSRVVRGPKREFISRSYNRILRLALRARFSDAQCGFKAIRADAARRLLPRFADQAWFFDTELLVLAQRRGMRIHEVAVDWTDDPDSRVDIVRTAARGPARRRPARTRRPGHALRAHRPGLDARLRRCSTCALREATAAGRGQRGRAGGDRGGQHPGQPPLHLRACAAGRAWSASTPPARSSTCSRSGSPAARSTCCAASIPIPSRLLEVVVLVVRQRVRHRQPLRRAAHLGVRRAGRARRRLRPLAPARASPLTHRPDRRLTYRAP